MGVFRKGLAPGLEFGSENIYTNIEYENLLPIFEHFWKCGSEMYTPFHISKYALDSVDIF